MQTIHDMIDEYNILAWRVFDILTQLRQHNALESSIIQAEEEMRRYIALRSLLVEVRDYRKVHTGQ